MAIAYFEETRPEAAPLYRSEEALSTDELAHLRMYRKFVTAARLGAILTPAMMVFVLYWMR